MEAAAVNPIDVRRAEGYGLRLLSLLGAGKFPMVLGNDFAGTIAAADARVSSSKPGDRVYGLRPTSARRQPRQLCCGQVSQCVTGPGRQRSSGARGDAV